ncbi:AsmA-like C-terminal domain-containing protein [Thermodesulfobacteriota bacterium]
MVNFQLNGSSGYQVYDGFTFSSLNFEWIFVQGCIQASYMEYNNNLKKYLETSFNYGRMYLFNKGKSMKAGKRKRLLIALMILVIILIAAAFIIPRLLDLNRYKGWIASKIETGVQGKVYIGHITWGISDGIWLKTDVFSITDAATFPVDLNLTNIYAKLAILPILSKRIEIEELTLDGPSAILKLESKTDENEISTPNESGNSGDDGNSDENIQSDIIKTGEGISQGTEKTSLGTLLPVEISVEKLSVQNGRFRIEDGLSLPGQRVIHGFNALNIEASDIIPGKKIDFQLYLEGDEGTGLGSLQAKGSFEGLIKTFIIKNPKIKLDTLISSLDTEIFKPYLKDSPIDNKLGGLVSLEINYEGDLFSHFNVDGSVNLSETTYNDPALWDDLLPGVETSISFQAVLDPHDIKVEDIKITIGNNTLNVHASINSWNEQPVIQDLSISSNLFPEELVPLVPWKLLYKYADKIRPVMEGGGHVNIETLTLDEIKLAEPFPKPANILPGVDLSAKVSNISIPSMSDIPQIELISCDLKLADGTVNIEDLKTKAVSTNLPTISGNITNLVDDPLIQVKVLGELKIPEKLGGPGTKLFRKAGIEKLTGTSDLDLTLTMQSSRPDEFRLEGSAILKDFRLKTSYSPVSIEKLNTKVSITPDMIKIADLSTVVVIPKTDETQSGRFSVKLNGRLDDWQKEPVVLLQSLDTSPISLNPIASLIPWEQVGEKADLVKEVLLAGGSLKINNFSLPGINLKKPPKDIKKVISKTKAAIRVSDIEIRPHPALPVFDGIAGNVSIDKGVLKIAETQGRMGPVTFPSVKLQASGFNDDLQITANLKGPIKVVGTDNKAIEKLLRERGFKSFTGVTHIDMNFKYDQKQPDDWIANGSLIIDDMNAESYPKGVNLDNLQGKIFFSRGKTTELTVEDLSAKVNQAPIKLAGKLTGGRTPDMVIKGKAYIKQLDLAEFDSLLPYLDSLKLKGKLDLNLDFNIPKSDIAGSQLVGTLNANRIGFHLPDYNTVVKDTDMKIGFEGDTVRLTKMDINFNDQFFHLEGSASDPGEPKISLLVQSPYLDVDRLLAKKEEQNESTRQKENNISDTDSNDEKEDLKKELPSWASNLTTDLRVNINKGKYRNQSFNDLNVVALYEKGVLQNYGVNLHLAKGKIITSGSADLRDLEKIPFIINPNISNLQIGELSSLFEVEKMPLYGPLSVNGRLEGNGGDVKDLLSSLNGTLRVDVGTGRMTSVGRFGKIITKILTFINISGLFSAIRANDFQDKGIFFKAIKSESTFSNGNMNLNNFIFISDSLNGNCQGAIDFPDEKIALQIVIEPLQTVDKILGLVPLLGKQAQKLTNIYLTVEGPLDDPAVRTTPTRGVTDAIKGTFGIPGAIFKDGEDLSKEIEEYLEKEGSKQ